MNTWVGAAAAIWLGMVLAISFLEAPLKFRASGVTVPLGLGIGRLVFAALNAVECVLAVGVLIALLLGQRSPALLICASVAIVLLVVQMAVIRPRLSRRSDRVLAGEDVPRSRAHHAYVVTEIVKVVGLGATVVVALELFTG